MVREHVKWEYELRHGQPINTVVGRAVRHRHERAQRPGLPSTARELLAVPRPTRPLPRGATRTVPAVADIDRGSSAPADMIAAAENPVIVMTTRRTPRRSRRSGLWRRPTAIAVLTGRTPPLSSSNPMNLGRVNGPALKAADLILVLNSPVLGCLNTCSPTRMPAHPHRPDPHFTTYPFAASRWTSPSPAIRLRRSRFWVTCST